MKIQLLLAQKYNTLAQRLGQLVLQKEVLEDQIKILKQEMHSVDSLAPELNRAEAQIRREITEELHNELESTASPSPGHNDHASRADGQTLSEGDKNSSSSPSS